MHTFLALLLEVTVFVTDVTLFKRLFSVEIAWFFGGFGSSCLPWLSINSHLQSGVVFLAAKYLQLFRVELWRWRQHVSPKRRYLPLKFRTPLTAYYVFFKVEKDFSHGLLFSDEIKAGIGALLKPSQDSLFHSRDTKYGLDGRRMGFWFRQGKGKVVPVLN
jgi:hypothetical protein